jgi:hypothetical protein
VKVYTYTSETAHVPLNEHDWVMYEVPNAGDRYWHGDSGFRVREIDASQDPPQVHLVYDHEWMDEIKAQLPHGYGISGGRGSDHGDWHFEAVTPNGRPLGPEFADGLDEALTRAIANAHEHHRQSQETDG